MNNECGKEKPAEQQEQTSGVKEESDRTVRMSDLSKLFEALESELSSMRRSQEDLRARVYRVDEMFEMIFQAEAKRRLGGAPTGGYEAQAAMVSPVSRLARDLRRL